MNKLTDIQRRKFIQKLGVMVGGSTLLSTHTQLQWVNAALAADSSNLQDDKSLVCIFLSGGNDGFNMFVPHQPTPYQIYRDIRQGLAIPSEQLLPVNGIDYGFHPSMTGVRDLYNQNNLPHSIFYASRLHHKNHVF